MPASSSMTSRVSATARLPRRHLRQVHDDPERMWEEARLERRVAARLTVELQRPRRALEHLDSHGVAAPEPHASRAVARAPGATQQLDERPETLNGAVRLEREHIEPPVV